MNFTQISPQFFEFFDFDIISSHLYTFFFLIYAFAHFVHLLIIFPCYSYVFRMSKSKDEQTLVYPLVYHLYSCTRFVSKCFYLFYLLFFIFLPIILKYLFIFYLLLFILICSIIISMVTSVVFNILIFLLAAQRFVLFSFPDWEKFVTPTHRQIKIFIRLIYLSVCGFSIYLGHLSTTVKAEKRKLPSDFKGISVNPSDEYFFSVFGILFMTVDGLIFSASIFYLIMYVKIRKMKAMISNIQSNPENNLFYQIQIMMIYKFCSLPIQLITFSMLNIPIESFMAKLFLSSVVNIYLINTLIVELSYLTSTRSHSIILRNLFRFPTRRNWAVFFGAQPSPFDSSIVSTKIFDGNSAIQSTKYENEEN